MMDDNATRIKTRNKAFFVDTLFCVKVLGAG